MRLEEQNFAILSFGIYDSARRPHLTQASREATVREPYNVQSTFEHYVVVEGGLLAESSG